MRPGSVFQSISTSVFTRIYVVFLGTIRYPHQLGLTGVASSSSSSLGSTSTSSKSPSTPSRSSSLRRSTSMSIEDVDDDSTRPTMPQRAYSTMETPVNASSASLTSSPTHPLSILSLDLKLGSTTTTSLPALLPGLSLATLSQLLSRRLTSSLSHLTLLRARVIDTSSRILVTGDLNAGKSTLVNALLRRDVMPSDQQPCTTVFCEVLDADTYNGGKEEIHAIKDVEAYRVEDGTTFERYELAAVNEVQELQDEYVILKAYVIDSRSSTVAPRAEEENPSFIKNGLVSISLIDAPGLNRDTLSTTALFARQAEIDVIVFVVSAENHFTLSAKEFLWNASQEKAFVFVVVNKWKAIKDKERCKRVVGEQIKLLSPATWEARKELVHFVDAADVISSTGTTLEVGATASFAHLEASLRSFVLLKRSKSKLAPAQHYLLNLLSDLGVLAKANIIAAESEVEQAKRKLEKVRPIHERLEARRDEVEEGVDKVEETVVERVKSASWTRLERALSFIVDGSIVPPLSPPHPSSSSSNMDGIEIMETPTALPEYPGLFGIWQWANDVKSTLVKALEAEIRAAEEDARGETSEGVRKVMHELGDRYLPAASTSNSPTLSSSSSFGPVSHVDADAVVVGIAEQSNQRVFRPEVMFAKRRRGVGRLAARGMGIGLGLGVAGLGTGWTAQDFDVTLVDLFDLERVYKSTPVSSSSLINVNGVPTEESEGLSDSGVVSVVSIGLGALSLFGSRAVGVKGAVEMIASVCDILGSPVARKWAAPVFAVICTFLSFFFPLSTPSLSVSQRLILFSLDSQRLGWRRTLSLSSLVRSRSTLDVNYILRSPRHLTRLPPRPYPFRLRTPNVFLVRRERCCDWLDGICANVSERPC